jgi:hypothetical protein
VRFPGKADIDRTAAMSASDPSVLAIADEVIEQPGSAGGLEALTEVIISKPCIIHKGSLTIHQSGKETR